MTTLLADPTVRAVVAAAAERGVDPDAAVALVEALVVSGAVTAPLADQVDPDAEARIELAALGISRRTPDPVPDE